MLRFIEAFFRNRWLISLPALLLLFSGVGLAVILPKEYESVATIWTETPTYFDDPSAFNRYLTPAQIQTNRFTELIRTYTFTRAIVDRTTVGAVGTEEDKLAFVDLIQKRLTITPEGEHLVRISFHHVRHDLSLEIVKVAIEEYNRVMIEGAKVQAEKAIAFYKERVTTYETTVIPRSAGAVTSYLNANPEVRRAVVEGGPVDPTYALLQQQADLDRQQYEVFKQRLGEILTRSEAARETQENTFRVMDPPWLVNASGPKYSKKQLAIFAAFGAALSAGYVAIFLALSTELDRTVRYAADARRRLQIPVLEVIPDYTPKKRGRRKKRSKKEAQAAAYWDSRTATTHASNNL